MLTCNCGSQNLIQSDFRQYGKSGFALDSKKSGIFNEVVILPEVWVCKKCRQIIFRVPEDKMELVKEK